MIGNLKMGDLIEDCARAQRIHEYTQELRSGELTLPKLQEFVTRGERIEGYLRMKGYGGFKGWLMESLEFLRGPKWQDEWCRAVAAQALIREREKSDNQTGVHEGESKVIAVRFTSNCPGTR
jgi:hypothetical protein